MTTFEAPETEPSIGTLTEELRLLVELVAERAAPWLESLVASGHGATEESDVDSDGAAPACGWCPLCAVVELVRGKRPEFVAKVLEQAAQLVALLRAVLADRWEPEQGVHMPGFKPEPKPGPEREPEAPRVQHIPVRRRGEDG